MSKQPNFVKLGEIDLSENEEKFLNVHYKVREAQRLRKIALEIEVSKLANKHRYEKMGQGDEIENLGDSEIVEALKELDAERAREKFERQVMNHNRADFT